jgi:hypothetical protein
MFQNINSGSIVLTLSSILMNTFLYCLVPVVGRDNWNKYMWQAAFKKFSIPRFHDILMRTWNYEEIAVHGMLCCVVQDITCVALTTWFFDNRMISLVNDKRALVAYTCNPSYSGGRAQEDCGLKSALANSLWDPISKKKKKSHERAGGMAQGVGLEFKLQYHTQK